MKYLKKVSSLALDQTRCRGCGICLQVCPHAVLTMKTERVEIVDIDACMECGACSLNCAFGAITVSAGVGCAYAILNGMLRGTGSACACGATPENKTNCC